MPSLQKRHNKEVRKSGEYITQSRKWVVLMFLLAIAIGIVASEVLTRGKITPYFEGGWLTFLVTEIVRKVREFIDMVSEAASALNF